MGIGCKIAESRKAGTDKHDQDADGNLFGSELRLGGLDSSTGPGFSTLMLGLYSRLGLDSSTETGTYPQDSAHTHY